MSCPHFFYGNCPIPKQEDEDLIKKFLADLDWLDLEEYESEEQDKIEGIKAKWEKRLKE